METINDKGLRDESIYPDENVLKVILGKSYKTYTRITGIFEKNEMTQEWKYYNDGKAWLCKVQKKKKTIIWMSAWKGYMQAVIYFPLKHLKRFCELDVSEKLKSKVRLTKNIGKSKPCIFEIRDNTVLEDIEKVMKFKIECV